MIRNYSKIILCAAVAILLSACGASKQSAAGSRQSESMSTVNVGDAASTFREVILSAHPWQKLRVPMQVSVESPVQAGMSGVAVMERGKSINLSLRVLGMEVAVLYLTGDSIIVLDKWNKRYVAEDLTKFLGSFPINISNVQDLLLGRPFLLGSDVLTTIDISKFEFENTNSGMWACQPTSLPAGINYAFLFLGGTLQSVMAGVAGKNPVEFRYADPAETRYGPMSGMVTFSADASG
ncbi:MAG: DUF4292 domain-containing protein, partial [Muribaculaceae bacterium]|nr:DUF4292 domain-containing protein [Muribaculaceae bacterium]